MYLSQKESRFINAAMSKDSTRKALADAFTDGVSGIGKALVSADGHRLHAVPKEASEGLRVLAGTLPKGRTGGAVTLVPIDPDFKPPDVSQVFPTGKPLWSLTVSPDVLTQGSGSGHEVKSGFIAMAPIDGKLAMAVRVPGSPWHPLADREHVACVDVRYLADALAGFEADVRVECWDAMSPIRLSLASGDVGPVALIMPVRT